MPFSGIVNRNSPRNEKIDIFDSFDIFIAIQRSKEKSQNIKYGYKDSKKNFQRLVDLGPFCFPCGWFYEMGS